MMTFLLDLFPPWLLDDLNGMRLDDFRAYNPKAELWRKEKQAVYSPHCWCLRLYSVRNTSSLWMWCSIVGVNCSVGLLHVLLLKTGIRSTPSASFPLFSQQSGIALSLEKKNGIQQERCWSFQSFETSKGGSHIKVFETHTENKFLLGLFGFLAPELTRNGQQMQQGISGLWRVEEIACQSAIQHSFFLTFTVLSVECMLNTIIILFSLPPPPRPICDTQYFPVSLLNLRFFFLRFHSRFVSTPSSFF